MRYPIRATLLLLVLMSIAPLVYGTNLNTLPPLKIIAHRGASAYAPENTITAFRLALDMQADGIELDVHVSADGKLMVIHDAHTGRTGDQHLEVRETSSHELRTLDVGRWKGPTWKGEVMPFLEEVLDLIPLDKELFIECKTRDSDAFLNALSDLWDKYETRLRSSTFISFHASILSALKQERPYLTTLLLIEDKETLEYYSDFILGSSSSPFNGAGIKASLHIDDEWVNAMKSQSRVLSVWTVNSPKLAQTYKEWDFHFITTDKPDLLISE